MVSPDNDNTLLLTDKIQTTDSEFLLRRVLKSSPQDLWLDTIRRARGTEHDGLVYWMLNQTECDFAVAVHAFYRSNPAQFLDNPRPLPSRPGPSEIFALLLLNWDTGSYRTHRLEVEAVDADARLIARTNQKFMVHARGSLPFSIPPSFLDPVGGSPAQVPTHMSPDDARHLWPIYAAMGLQVPKSAPGLKRKIARAKVLLQFLGLRRLSV